MTNLPLLIHELLLRVEIGLVLLAAAVLFIIWKGSGGRRMR